MLGSDLYCFNGATAFQLWIVEDMRNGIYDIEKFQWGHGFSAMDRVEK